MEVIAIFSHYHTTNYNITTVLKPNWVEDYPLPSAKVLFYLNTGHESTTMQMMKDNRHLNNQIQKPSNGSFEVIELNVDEPIMFQKGKWSRRIFERKAKQ
jgi:hypothetical protein